MMKKIFALLLILSLLATSALAEFGLTDFETIDLTGETVTQDVFADYDLTMVNIWATWCGYCIQEMPELAKLKDMLPENVNLISICDDAITEYELAAEILHGTGATNFQSLIATQEMNDQFLNQIYSFPTTYFMDSEGKPITDPIIGVPSLDGAADIYYAIIEQILTLMEAE